MLETKVFESLQLLDRNAWNACFTDKIEDFDYLLAVEKAGIAGFEWRYLTVWDDGKLVAAAPFFLTDYRLDTTLQGAGKKVTGAVTRAFPKLLTHRLACIGSPCIENVLFGFANAANRVELLETMLEFFEQYIARENYKLLGIKDLAESLMAEFEQVFKNKKYSTLPAMQSAWLDIDFKTVDEYISRLSQKMRKDLRRKMKSFGSLRIENRIKIDDVLPQIFELYKSTKSRSEWQFEELTESYFRNVLQHMQGRSFCTLYYSGDQLLAANLLVHNEHILLDKFFCMDEAGRNYNLYFLSWLNNLQTCLDRGFKRYETGQAYDDMKSRLGCKLSTNTMYFKHRNRVAQGLLRMVAPYLAADEVSEIKEAA